MILLTLLLQIILAIAFTYIFIKIAHNFDKLASDIDVVTLILIVIVSGIVSSIVVAMYLPDGAEIFIFLVVFLAVFARLRMYELLTWGRYFFLYSIIVLSSYILAEIAIQFIV